MRFGQRGPHFDLLVSGVVSAGLSRRQRLDATDAHGVGDVAQRLSARVGKQRDLDGSP